MKWTEEKMAKLRELCMKEISNNDIARFLDCKVEDVYSKRSQLGLTINKVNKMKGVK